MAAPQMMRDAVHAMFHVKSYMYALTWHLAHSDMPVVSCFIKDEI